MGQTQSRKRRVTSAPQVQGQSVAELLEDYVITGSGVNDQLVLEFDPVKSRAICVGIDKQQHDKYVSRSLGDVAAKDASLLGESFVTNVGFLKERVHVYTSASKPHLCTKEAIKTLILNYAGDVEEDGLFTIYFSGHIAVYKGLESKDDWVHVLAPADFAGDVVSGITADNFVEWIRQSNCKACHILIVLDCCYAGGIGKKIALAENLRPNIHVMCACAAGEVSLPITVLGSSTFCYFLLHVLKKGQPNGKFTLHNNMDEISELCQAFSSLLMSYSSERGGLLRPALIQPEMYSSDYEDETDVGQRLNMLFDLYDKQHHKPSLHPLAGRWFKSRAVQESLQMLFAIRPLPESLYNGIFCALLYSISGIHLAYDRTHVAERNLFITAAISVISAIGYSYPDVSITAEQLKLGVKYYYLPICSAGIQAGSIERLFMELHVQSNNTEATYDQSTLKLQVSQMSLWQPLSEM